MSHPFGDKIRQYLSRKHGLSQNKLALEIHCDRSLVSRMCNGERLYAPSARIHIVNMIGWFLDQKVVNNLDEADALLDAANLVGLRKDNPSELLLINRLAILENQQELVSINPDVNPLTKTKTPLNNLPYPFYGHFVGRNNEFNKIVQYLRPGSETERYIYPLSIDGIGGIGKSSLALEVGYYFCNKYQEKNFHGIVWISAKEEWFLPAGPVPKSTQVYKTLHEILWIISKTLGFSDLLDSLSENVWVETVYQQLQKKPTLLIIDNLDTIDDDSVISFLQELPPPTKAILTTRRRVEITRNIRLGEMSKGDAVLLIDKLSTDFTLNEEQKEKLYVQTGGVPLFIVWALGQINSGMSVAVLLKKLGSTHIKDIAAYCFEQSIETIKRHEYYYELMCALSIFETGATRTTIGKIAGLPTDEITRDDGLIFLEKLAMLTRSGNLFTMLPLTRSYLSNRLADDHALKQIIMKNLLNWIEEIIRMDPETDRKIIEYLDGEQKLLLATVQYCIDHERYYLAKEIISFVRKYCSHFQDLEWKNLNNALERKRLGPIKSTKVDWDIAVKPELFYGRSDELKKIRDWVVSDNCYLISIIGFGGMGKSSLAIKVAEAVSQDFDYLIWKSLANGPLPTDLYLQILQVLMESPIEEIPTDTNQRLEILINYLSQFKCLIILDNFETTLTKGNTDKFLTGYEDYEELFQKLVQRNIRSCVMITSREKPITILNLEQKSPKVKSLAIEGLKRADIQLLFNNEGIQPKEELLTTLIHKYSGNPLAIKWAINLLKDESTGDVLEIIGSKLLPRDINSLVTEQLERLNNHEREVLIWIAIEHGPTDFNSLYQNIISDEIRENLEKNIEQLARRSLIDLTNGMILLSPFLTDYIIDNLIAEITDELLLEEVDLFCRFALLKANAKDHIRIAQKLLIVEPLVQELINSLGDRHAYIKKMNRILDVVKKKQGKQQGYAIGNIINLLTSANSKLNQYDFSRTYVNQALLSSTNLQDVNFHQSDFKNAVFAEIFDIVLSVAFSPNTNLIATGTVNGKILIWDNILSKQIDNLSGHNGWVRSIKFHPHNKNILASGAGDHTVMLWDIAKRDKKVFAGHTDWVRSVSFSPNGSLLASAGSDAKIILWDIESGKITTTLEGHTDWIWSICFTQTGNQIISGSNDNTVRIWNLSDNRAIVLHHPNSRVMAVAYSSSNDIVASGGTDNLINIWNTETGALIRTLSGHNNFIWCLKFSPDGKYLFSGGMDKNIIIWDVSTGNINKILNGHTGYVTSFDCDHQSNLLLSSGYDQSIRLWDIQTGQCIRSLEGKSNNVNTISFQQTGALIASGGDDRLVHFWDYSTGIHKVALNGHSSGIKTLSFSHNGLLLASGSDDQTVKVWDVQNGVIRQTLKGHSAWIYSVAFNAEDTILASGADDFSVRLWNIETSECIRVLRQENFIYSVAFSPSGDMLASGGADKIIWIWDVSTGKILKKLEGHILRVNTLSYGRNNLIVSGGDDRLVKLWSPVSETSIMDFKGHEGPIRSVCFAPNGEIIASCGDDRSTRVWDLSGNCIATIKGDSNYRSCAINQNGDLLAISCSAGSIEIWDINTQKLVSKLKTKRIYENMNIKEVTGLTNVQKNNLIELGAIE